MVRRWEKRTGNPPGDAVDGEAELPTNEYCDPSGTGVDDKLPPGYVLPGCSVWDPCGETPPE
jgi:hypothetical protein